MNISNGMCECGCGKLAPVAKKTRTKVGHKKGQPVRFLPGHMRRGNLIHGLCYTPTWRAYSNAKRRCNKQNHKAYKDYGGRGIKFLYNSFEAFLADVGLKPHTKLQLDRINNNGHYEPGNCRWASHSEQAANKRRPTRVKLLEVRKTLLEIEKSSHAADGYSVVPAYLMEQLHNTLFLHDKKHDYTEAPTTAQVTCPHPMTI